MILKLFSMNHRDQGLSAVEQLTPHLSDSCEVELVACPGVHGALLLSTCNRIEILLDVEDEAAADAALLEVLSTWHTSTATAEHPQDHAGEGSWKPTEYSETEAVRHLCSLACGLESMVVGEREITGQLRHAQRRAEIRQTLSPAISLALSTAFRAARMVERETGLSGMGRSVAAIALNHAAHLIGDYSDANVVLFGTGSYAGAVVTQLKERGCKNIFVHSASGRAQAFARGRGLKAINNKQLGRVLAQADMIVSARGKGVPTVSSEHVRAGMASKPPGHGLVVLDLAVARDVDMGVADIPGITLIDLETVRSLVPELEPMKTTRAKRIVDEVVADYAQREAARCIAPIIVEMRAQMAAYIAQEMASLPQRQLQRSDVERVLRRFSNRVLHQPTTAAHMAGAQGSAGEFMAALQLVTGWSMNTTEEETA